MNLSIIAAIGKNNELGKNNDLIWKFPIDMKFFRETTNSHTIVMGRKTFESLPKMLPNRKHVVLTRGENEFPNEVEVYKSVRDFLLEYKDKPEEIFDIGGASIYSELLEFADNLYLTEIEATCEDADVYFPSFDKNLYDRSVIATNIDERTNIEYSHVLYKRKK